MTTNRNAPGGDRGHSKAAGGPASKNTPARGRARSNEPEPMSPELVDDWHSTLMEDEEWLSWWTDVRGVSVAVLRDQKIGVQGNRKDADDGFRYTIPVPDRDGVLVDVKKYAPGMTERKNIHTRGHGSPCRLCGIDWLVEADPEAEDIWVVGGEPDQLRALSEGLLAVTATSGEGALPRAEDLEALRGFRVNICLDQDKAGRAGAVKWVAKLLPIAAEVRNIEWSPDQGKDLTDFLNNGHTVEELVKIAMESPPLAATQRPLADLLAAALKKVENDGRNNTGFWLAQQLRDERYPLATAKRFMVEEYHPAVDDPDDPFPVEEITGSAAALYQAYSVPAREPSGLGPSHGTSVDATGDYAWNDSGNADLLLDLHGDDMRIVPEIGRNGMWFAWTGHGWAPGDAVVNDFALDVPRVWSKKAAEMAATGAGDKEAMKAAGFVRAHATKTGNDSALRAMLRQAALRDGMAVPLGTFDADPSLLPFRNKVVVLGSSGVSTKDHDREDYSRTVVNVDYDPAATSPEWSAFLDLFVPRELQPFLQKLVGYSLFGNNNERLLVFLMGPSSTGKSTFIELLARALGRGIVYLQPVAVPGQRSRRTEAGRAGGVVPPDHLHL